MAACNSFLYLVLVAASFFTGYVVFAETDKVSFTIDIIHRDSQKSPFYNPLETSSQRVANAFLRSRDHVDHIRAAAAAAAAINPSSSSTPQSMIIEGNGDYLMKYSIGTPPLETLGVIDTGSDFIWSQCKPCENCYKQSIPMFDPSHSTTYANLSCRCLSKGRYYSAGGKEACKYFIQYGDSSSSQGDIALETITLGSSNGQPTSFPDTMIGCGHINKGGYEKISSGIVGFGYGQASLVSQLNSSIDGKFSYCLVPSTDQASKLSFGENAESSNSTDTVITPPTVQNLVPYYFLTMEAISVGGKTIQFSQNISSNASEEGNIIIDSGTTITYIPTHVYTELEASLKQEINLKRVHDPNGLFSLCFKSESDNKDEIPVITAHFRDADVKLQPLNTFLQVSDEVICFAFAPLLPNFGIPIFGNVAQMNFLVAYDIQKKTVSFTPKDCTQY